MLLVLALTFCASASAAAVPAYVANGSYQAGYTQAIRYGTPSGLELITVSKATKLRFCEHLFVTKIVDPEHGHPGGYSLASKGGKAVTVAYLIGCLSALTGQPFQATPFG
jgi:hypothetical protein